MFGGKPSNRQVRTYGENLGEVLISFAGSAKAMGLIGKVAPALAKKLRHIKIKPNKKFLDRPTAGDNIGVNLRSNGTGNVSRNGALREAKRDAGIPRGQQPEAVNRVDMRSAQHEGGHVIKDSKGRAISTREYVYTNKNGKKIVIQDHSAGHQKGGQGPHFNVRPADNIRTGKVPGTKEHYPFKK